jgi:iron donor protein CyaY
MVQELKHNFSETEFYKICDETLEKLQEKLEEFDENQDLDVEYSDGILEILILENDKIFIINRNAGNQKIWYSSPVSGADYFSYNQDLKKWLNAKNIDLEEKLFGELKKL